MITYGQVKDFIEVNNCILLTSEKDYVNTNCKLEIRCDCGEIYSVSFSKFKHRNKRQCNKCGIENRMILKKLKYEDIRNYVESQNCILITSEQEYIDTQENLKIKCFCGNTFYKSYSSMKFDNSCHCKTCGFGDRSKVGFIQQYKKIVEYVKSQNNSCSLLTKESEYKTNKELTFLCQCGNDFTTSLFNYKNNNKRQCNMCNIKKRSEFFTLTNEDFLERVNNLVGKEYTFLERYIKGDTKIQVIHNSCGNIYKVRPSQFLNGARCSKCQHRSYIKTTEEYEQEIYDLVGNEYEVLDEYTGNKIHMKMKHVKCNSVYMVTPNTFLRGCRCPTCNESYGEQKVRKWLEVNKIEFLTQYTFDDLISEFNNLLRFDFAVFYNKEFKFLIEYDGQGHYSEKPFGLDVYNITKKYDNIKNIYCTNFNIPLLRIPYWEFENVEYILYQNISKYGIPIKNEEKKEVINVGENPFLGMHVYPTGKFQYKKDELKIKLESLGAIVESGYKKSLDMLICGGDMSKSGKAVKAEKDGVKMVSEEYLMQYIK